MSPASNVLHSIPFQSCHETCFKLCPDWYADNYHSVCQMMMRPQETPHVLIEQLQQVLQYT